MKSIWEQFTSLSLHSLSDLCLYFDCAILTHEHELIKTISLFLLLYAWIVCIGLYVQDYPTFCSIHLAFNFNHLSVPSAENHPHSMISPSPICIWMWHSVSFMPHIIFGVKAKEFHFAFIHPEHILPTKETFVMLPAGHPLDFIRLKEGMNAKVLHIF